MAAGVVPIHQNTHSHVVTCAELLRLDLPPREMVLTPWLPCQGLAMVYAERGIGKTFFALSAAYAVASGSEFLGWRAKRARPVLYVDGEMPAVALQERLRGIVEASPTEPPEPDYFRILTPDIQGGDPMPDLAKPASWTALESHLLGVALIVIDSISTLTSGDESDGSDWRPVQDWALRQRRLGRSVLLVHHAGKGGQQRGTSKREDVLDTTIALRRPRDYKPEQGARFEIHFEKHRGFHGRDTHPREAALQSNNGFEWQVRELDDYLTERVAALINAGSSQRIIAAEVGVALGTVNRHVRLARTKGWIE